ncbi:cobalamin synthesis protein/P47K [Salinarchaeum sp. Harcht-Bsk1]|uniref:CobW family GTP-binding protein n=1 Tax=Salinarchaeum sp. Harcht-Bsk1 TaxID=1333523 RepID=UPI00034247F9|nr:GTP-binding protein [Salinarchaeum sp. Harcht-Bsk1]AGN01661.1 cobalamin synthesis protein/P47K [Salinarchaeum sp. Harcht-Bsk1]
MAGNDGIPVTVLAGPLGAGKTTVLNHLLTDAGDRRIAVLVNDMGEVNVDADLLAAGSDLAADGGVAELSNGCICCELQDDLESEVARLAEEREFDVLVVEASGISEPGPVGRLFVTDSRAAAVYDLDTLVTVVDAPRFWETFGGDEEAAGHPEGGASHAEESARDGEDGGNDGSLAGRVERETAPGSTDRPLSDLVIEQVETANVLLLNKCDLLDDEHLGQIEALLGALNPDAPIHRTVHGDVDLDLILETGLYAEQRDASAAGGLSDARTGLEHSSPEEEHGHEQEGLSDDSGHGEHDGHDHDHDHHDSHGDQDHHDHDHPEAVYGVDSVAFRRRRPFHPQRLLAVLGDLPPAVVRSKGLFWAAGRDDLALLYSQAGPTGSVEGVGPWIASLPDVEADLYRSNTPDLPWEEPHGDRRSELVFIGRDVPEEELFGALEDALVTDEEWDPEDGWLGENDPADAVGLPASDEDDERLEFSPRESEGFDPTA